MAHSLLNERHVHGTEVKAEKVIHEEEQLNHALESLLQEIENFTEAAAIHAKQHESLAFKILVNFPFSFVIGWGWFIPNCFSVPDKFNC